MRLGPGPLRRPFAPEESKETAPGFRGTRLWNQSLVCYTFVQQTAAAWGSSALLSSQQSAPAGQYKRQRKADSLCLKAQAVSLLLSAEQRYRKPRRSGTVQKFFAGVPEWFRFAPGFTPISEGTYSLDRTVHRRICSFRCVRMYHFCTHVHSENPQTHYIRNSLRR